MNSARSIIFSAAIFLGCLVLPKNVSSAEEPAWPPLIPVGGNGEGLVSFKDPGKWIADGPKVRFEQDNQVVLDGSGVLKLRTGILDKDKISPFTRLLVDYFIEGGPASDLGLAMKGLPGQDFGGRNFPRWACVDVTWPVGRWVTCSYDLGLCEWPGASGDSFEAGDVALTFINTPGSMTTSVRMRNPRLVKDAFAVKRDWLKPYEPLIFDIQKDGTLKYSKTFTLESKSDKPLTIEASTEGSAADFKPKLEPVVVELPPGGKATVLFTAQSAPGMKSLQHARVQVWFREADRPETAQIRSFMIAAPAIFPASSSLPKPKMPDEKAIEMAMKRGLRMPTGPAAWIGQSDHNRYSLMEEGDGESLRNPKTGEIVKDNPHISGMIHRWNVRDIMTLSAAYANTGKVEYARKVRDWFILYAEKANDYQLALPLSEATSALCPGNATYVQASVIVGPMMVALAHVFKSDAFSPEDRSTILRDFILPRALESMKINPALTNMQDEINKMLFHAGIASGDPNLMAQSLFGDHGLQAKINLSFASDGSTEESIATNYHNVVVHIVSDLVEAVRSTGIDTGLSFDRLEKAKKILDNLAMPDGRIPNRGDCPVPVGNVAGADKLPSLTLEPFGMSVLREGQGEKAIYVAIDHRPPAVTHSHHDKLGIIVFGSGKIFGCDDGSLYNIDAGSSHKVPDWSRREKWGYHSLCHNTVAVDRKSQHFGGAHKLYFQGDDSPVRAVGAWTDTVFDGVRFERHIALRNGVLIVADRLFSDAEHCYDLAHHSFGKISTDAPLQPIEKLGSEPTYELAADAMHAKLPADKGATVSWDQDGAKMHYQILDVEGQPFELFTATGWANVAYQNVRQPAPFLLVRKSGKNALFLSVMNFGDAPVKVGAARCKGDRLEIPLPDGTVVFDFKNNKVSVE